MSRPPSIRDLESADLGAVARIYGHHVRTGVASFELDPPDAEEMRRRWRAVVDKGLPYLVAELEGIVAGFAYAGEYRPRPAYRFTVESSVYVAPEAARRGIGRALMQEVIARCRAKGLRNMIAVVGDSANAPSLRLHESLGFERVGVLRGVGFKFGRRLDTVVLQLQLTELE